MAIYHGNPQIEEGSVRIANELFRALRGYAFSGSELRILLSVIEHTYGYNRRTAQLSYSYIAKLTGLTKRSVARTIKRLVAANVLKCVAPHTARGGYTWMLNNHYQTWDVPCNALSWFEMDQQQEGEDCADMYRSSESDRIAALSENKMTSCSDDGSDVVPEPEELASSKAADWTTRSRRSRRSGREKRADRDSSVSQAELRAMFSVLGEVTGVDVRLMRGKIGAFAARLLRCGYKAEWVREWYGRGGWWYQNDWRGRRGQLPTLEQIVATIRQAFDANCEYYAVVQVEKGTRATRAQCCAFCCPALEGQRWP